MNLNQYQTAAFQFASYPDEAGVFYTALGLAEEAGEVAGKIAKLIRSGDITPGKDVRMTFEQKQAIKKELGDVLWQLSALAVELGLDLESIATDNIAKLSDRLNRGVIIGEGDAR